MSFLKGYIESVSSYVSKEFLEEEPDSITEKSNNVQEREDVNTNQDVTVAEPNKNWLYSLYSKAYDQTGEVLELVKNDLDEFHHVLTNDAKAAVHKTANVIRDKLAEVGEAQSDEPAAQTQDGGTEVDHDKVSTSQVYSSGFFSSSGIGGKFTVGLGKVMDKVSHSFYIPPESDDEDELIYAGKHVLTESVSMLNKCQARIALLESRSDTFTEIPPTESALGPFVDWLPTFDVGALSKLISEQRLRNDSLNAIYDKMVPAQLSHSEFWGRYYYRVASIKAEEARRQELKDRMLLRDQKIRSTDDWDEDDQAHSDKEDETPCTERPQSNSSSSYEYCSQEQIPTEIAGCQEGSDIQSRDKGDMVVVSKDCSTDIKESDSLEDMSDEDITEEDKRKAVEAAKKLAKDMSETEQNDDWDSWS